MADGLTIDTREKTRRIKDVIWYEFIEKNCYVPIPQYKALPYGDYLLENSGVTMLIERKEIKDLCDSVSKRGEKLKKRLANMRINADYTALLIEGPIKVESDNTIWFLVRDRYQICIRYDKLQKYLFQQQLNGTHLIYTPNLKYSLYTIFELYKELPNFGNSFLARDVNTVSAYAGVI